MLVTAISRGERLPRVQNWQSWMKKYIVWATSAA